MLPPRQLKQDQEATAERRTARYRLRDAAAAILPKEAVARCGRYYAGDKACRDHPGLVALKVGEAGASIGGVVTCKNLWACPACAAKVGTKRRDEIEKHVAAHEAAGGVVYMVAFTVPHHRRQPAGALKVAFSTCFRKMQAGAKWKRAKTRASMIGSFRSMEVTVGPNGFHPHVHALLYFDRDDPAAAADFGEWLFETWARIVAADPVLEGRCNRAVWQFEKARNAKDAGGYVSKWGCHNELSGATVKRAKDGHLTMFQVLESYADNPNERDAAIFIEYFAAFKGARQIAWSHNFKNFYSDDAELAEDPPAATVAFMYAKAYEIVAARPGGLAGLYAALEVEAYEASGTNLIWRLGLHTGLGITAFLPAKGGAPPPRYTADPNFQSANPRRRRAWDRKKARAA